MFTPQTRRVTENLHRSSLVRTICVAGSTGGQDEEAKQEAKRLLLSLGCFLGIRRSGTVWWVLTKAQVYLRLSLSQR